MKLTSRQIFLLSLISILFLLSVAQFLKGDLDDGIGVRNLEAPYHVLLTVEALKNSPIENHYLLPSVSLGLTEDKFISWGATVPTETGDYVYTSFNSPGFILPYLWFEITGLDVNIQNLAYLNSILGVLVVLILLAMMFEVLTRFLNYSHARAGLVTTIALIPAIFSHEVLVSHGLVFWVHSFYQFIFVATLYAMLRWFKADTNNGKKSWALILIVLLFLGPYTEWTGFIFNIGLFFVLMALSFVRSSLIPNPKRLALLVAFLTTVAGCLMVAHYAIAVGFWPAIEAFQSRFFARSTTRGSFPGLFIGYLQSYGYFLLIFCASLFYLATNYFRQQTADSRQQTADKLF
ncbi:hypothetical protein P8S54_05720 [Thiomicrospira sp. R3]|uniref:hypothetical protein n=1 Tax=Thiomicrospira sp. R3 TaxID=3035472 RepID=UPI00259BE712|nr:hypothetical protein [Thiomicrospira sp. R3]WFE67735.1 hypothetical protein P8S54_05720 [Thiomicrospira sp. R3]